MDDLREMLTDDDHERALERFLPAWFDLELQPAPDGPLAMPRVLERLWNSHVQSEVFVQDRLVPRSDAKPLANGWIPCIEENQVVWTACFVPDGSDAPHVGNVVEFEDDQLLDMRLPECLLRAVLKEARIRAPNWASSEAAVDQRVLDEQLTKLFPPLDVDPPVSIPGYWTDGRQIVGAYERNGKISMHVGMKNAADFDNSPLPELCEWRGIFHR